MMTTKVIDYGIMIRIPSVKWLDRLAAIEQSNRREARRRELSALREASQYPETLAAVQRLDARGEYPSFAKVCEEVGKKVHTRTRRAALKACGYDVSQDVMDSGTTRYKKK